MKVTVKYDCPVQEGIVTHIKDSVRFSDTTASFMLVRGQQYRLYAEAFDENSTMYMCDTTFIASDSFIVCKLHEVSTITIQLDTAWIRTEPHTW